MASYYKLFAAGMPMSHRCSIRWMDYLDINSDVELLTATMPVYKVAPGQAMCDGNAATETGDDFAELLGVVAFDMNVIAPISPLFDEPSWDSFWRNIVQDSCSCPTIDLTGQQLEALRRATSYSQTCGALADVSAEMTGVPRASPDPSRSTCGTGIEPVDGKSGCGLRWWLIALLVLACVIGCCCCTTMCFKLQKRAGKTNHTPTSGSTANGPIVVEAEAVAVHP